MQGVQSDTRKLIAPFILFQFLTSPYHRSSLHLSHGLGSDTDIFHPHAFLRQYYRSSTGLLWARSSFSISIIGSDTCQPSFRRVQVLTKFYSRHRCILSPVVCSRSHDFPSSSRLKSSDSWVKACGGYWGWSSDVAFPDSR